MSKSEGPLDLLMRVVLNLAALGLMAGLVALVIATIIHET
jgi:hypothetical protein